MAIASISSVWTPDIWIRGMREKQLTYPSILNSGIAVSTPEFDALASGAGIAVNVPFFKDITDQADEVQVEDTAPVTINGVSSGKMVAPLLNRVTKNAAT